jgi:hypothetical protein
VTARIALAVLRARLYAQRRIVFYACVAAFLAGFIQPDGLAAPLFLCSLLGITIALAQSPGLHPHLDSCEASAPLFGRHLARAKALVPCVAATLAVGVYAVAEALRGTPGVTVTFVIALGAVVPATLIALSATIRRGAPRVLYVALAACVAIVAYALVSRAHSLIAELSVCAIVAFLALRQYGEALGRYDPI